MTTLLDVRGMKKSTNASFRKALVLMASTLNIDPNWITPTMAFESGFDPAIQNKLSNATGLIQFMPSTAKSLGTTVDELKKMTAEQQLEYVKRYYSPYANRIKSPGDVYMATFMPKFIGSDPGTVIATAPEKAYAQNSGLDRSKKGYITVADATQGAVSIYTDALTRPPIVDDDGVNNPPFVSGPGGNNLPGPITSSVIQRTSNDKIMFVLIGLGLSFLVFQTLKKEVTERAVYAARPLRL